MLTDLLQKVKTFLKENQKDLFLASLVFLIGLGSFGLGRLSVIWPEKEPVRIDQVDENDESAYGLDGTARPNSLTESRPSRDDSAASSVSPTRGNYVASKNGSSYHLPTCPGAKQIKEENKVWFATADEARRTGYKPAGNCPGL